MTNSVDPTGQTGVNPLTPSQGNPAGATGSFRGERVDLVPNPTAQLQEAAEELTFLRSESVAKRLAQRRLASGRALDSFALEQARKYLEQVPDLERNQKLADFANSLSASGEPPGPQELRQRAKEFSEDPTHQFLALSFSLGRAVSGNAEPALIAALEGAVESLREENGPAIQAGLNVSTVAQTFSGEELGSTQDLRDLYRDVVLDCEEINDAFQRIVKGHPGKTFDDAVRFLLNALGADLAAALQSVSRTRLRQIVNDMHQLKSLNSVHQQCRELMLRTQRNYGADTGPLAARNLMSELLSAQGRAWQGADAFDGLPEKMGVNSDEGAIYLLQGFKELVRSMPLKAFGDDLSQRDRVMISVQQALDLAIDNEAVDD
ncbi:MAG: type III secretion system gatekeeper subunit SctW [Gammaproteobacteria bacterium]|nr:type III secretion system gatekeeper subunit SctW [Gammaproteobacteria bacterium]MDE0365317.1 type III secretion system gatekeeper subunit SctW [Gammaproteobacteria bacterium]